MLNFLDNKQANRLTVKPLVKYQPSLVYGHTEESPTYFINPHTIYYQGSAKENPIQTKLKALEPFPQISPSKKHKLKRNVSTNIDELMITNYEKKGPSQELAKRLSHPDIISSSNYNITNGEFSNFLDRHKHHKDMGVIYKDEKNGFNSTQKVGNSQSLSKLSWNKSINTESKSNFSNSIYKPKLTVGSEKQTTEKDSILESHPRSLWMTRSNSVSIFEKAIPKAQIRYRRQQFIDTMKKEAKQHLETKYSSFGLPKLGVEHQLFLLQKKKYGKNEVKSQMDEINEDLNKFEKNLFVRLK